MNSRHLFDTEFDIVISFGENCGAALHMRGAGLKTCAFPFDWITGVGFEQRLELIENSFQGFLEKENMCPIEAKRKFAHAAFKDTYTGFLFYHDFSLDIPFEKDFPEVKNKYNRRIARLYHKVEESPKVLFVWFGLNSTVSVQRLMEGRDRLARFFHKEVYLLALQNDKSAEEPQCEQCSPYLIRYIFDFKATPDTDMMGEKKNFHAILSGVKLKGKWKNRLRKINNSIICAFIPFKKLRVAARLSLREKG